jgi:hypothetical protein
MSDEKPMGQVVQIDEARIRDHLGEMVRSRPALRRRPLRAQRGSAGHPGWQLRSDAANRSRRLIKCAKESARYPDTRRKRRMIVSVCIWPTCRRYYGGGLPIN